MKRSLMLPLASMAGAVALVAAGALPATAATLADGDELYAYSDVDGLFSSTDAGGLTLIGEDTDHWAWGADYDPVTGLAYFFDDSVTPCTLYSLDIATGADTLIGPVTDGVTDYEDCDGVDITAAGDIWLAVESTDLVRVSPLDASVLQVVSVTGFTDQQEIAFIATDPTTGILYAGDYDSNVFSIDKTTGAATYLATTDYIESGDFDSAGTFWYLGEGSGCENGLYSFDPTDIAGTAHFQGDLRDDGGCIGAWALFTKSVVAPPTDPPAPTEPSLAATGAPDGWPVAGLAALLLVLGFTISRTARRRSLSGS